MAWRFHTVDVFTDQPFGGNPLAVITDARGLSSAAMQRIAAEFNLAETTFVLPPDDPAHDAKVRIFTPRAEVPFAGHPNIGTAFVLGRLRGGNDRLLFEETAGLVPIDLIRQNGAVVGATLTAPQPLSRGETVTAEAIAACVGLAVANIATGRHQPVVASVGIGFVIAELSDQAALARARPNVDAIARLPPAATGLHLYVAGADGALATRMFAPLYGVPEDPATGSANAALAALLADLAPAADATLTFRIVQGVEMGRPSLLNAEVAKTGSAVTRVRIGGHCIAMMEGSLLAG
jgi:trans-2,3-dihydro-3-hydroxyanthranilate isomerase